VIRSPGFEMCTKKGSKRLWQLFSTPEMDANFCARERAPRESGKTTLSCRERESAARDVNGGWTRRWPTVLAWTGVADRSIDARGAWVRDYRRVALWDAYSPTVDTA